jgi:hypothetical protein
MVVSAELPPEPIMTTFKACATRRLIEAGVIERRRRVWSRHGSTGYLWAEQEVDRACVSVLEGQDGGRTAPVR